MCLTTSAPSCSRRPETTTLAPARANPKADALPMPEVPPVTSATLPVNVLLVFTCASVPSLSYAQILKQLSRLRRCGTTWLAAKGEDRLIALGRNQHMGTFRFNAMRIELSDARFHEIRQQQVWEQAELP